MRTLALAVALAVASPAAAALPQPGVLVPGTSLGGIRLGMTQEQVRAVWGSRFGVCRRCAEPTWYYTYRPHRPEGAGVVFRRGRVSAVFTHWAPAGWRTTNGIRIGDSIANVIRRHGPLPRTQCSTYSVLTAVRRGAVTAFYVVDEEVWGLGLTSARLPACR